jgi:hypothetical protein
MSYAARCHRATVQGVQIALSAGGGVQHPPAADAESHADFQGRAAEAESSAAVLWGQMQHNIDMLNEFCRIRIIPELQPHLCHGTTARVHILQARAKCW